MKKDRTEMNEKDLDRENESDRGLETEVGGIVVEEGETGVETAGVDETGVGRRETGAETETGEGRSARREGIDLEKEGAAGVVTEVDDLEVQLALCCMPTSKPRH